MPARLRYVLPLMLLACSATEESPAGTAHVLPAFSEPPGVPTVPVAPGSPEGAAGAGGGSTTIEVGEGAGEAIPPVVVNMGPGSQPASGASGGSSAGAAGAAPTREMPAAPGEGSSSGCGVLQPPQGELSIAVAGGNAAYAITLPPGYDPNVPYPLIFGFHGRGRTHLQFQQVDASQIQSELGGRAVMAYLKSQGGDGWNFANEVEPNVEFFEALYPQLLDTYCVDLDRVFAVGHSSGGYFSNILACRFGDRFRGIGAVAGASQETDCIGRVAALLVHGVRDSVVSFASGVASRDAYLARNRCGSMTQPAPIGPCVIYGGCADGFPVRWCEHEEPTYENTNHGWPSFASRAVGEFLFSIP